MTEVITFVHSVRENAFKDYSPDLEFGPNFNCQLGGNGSGAFVWKSLTLDEKEALRAKAISLGDRYFAVEGTTIIDDTKADTDVEAAIVFAKINEGELPGGGYVSGYRNQNGENRGRVFLTAKGARSYAAKLFNTLTSLSNNPRAGIYGVYQSEIILNDTLAPRKESSRKPRQRT